MGSTAGRLADARYFWLVSSMSGFILMTGKPIARERCTPIIVPYPSYVSLTARSAPRAIITTSMPILDINEIRAILPHRYPFLLVDRIVELDADRIVGSKNVTVNEPFFTGHFPDFPVMPGVLIVEAMAQAAGVLVLKSIPNRDSTLVL